MPTINQVKQQAEADTPLLFFECILPSGDAEYWCTHAISFNGEAYSARLLRHNLFDLQLSADDAMDGISQLTVTLANADSAMSELNAAVGFKGSKLTVYFAFADLASGSITTESTVLFRGVAGDPDLIEEATLTLSFTNKLSLQRVALPDVRVQRGCPWNFPATSAQRMEAKDGGALGPFSRFYRCGYSADIAGGVGNFDSGQAFTSCDKSRGQCIARGMFRTDAAQNSTARFGGFEFVPSAINVRTFGDKTSHLSPVLDNAAKFNDPVPLVYGTGWLKAPVILSRNDGNLTHMEVLLNCGAIEGILKVVVNDVEIPQAVSGKDMTTTGWYSIVTSGSRQGNFNLDFTDSNGAPLGDPYGSLAVCAVIVPNRISSGRALPNVEVLLSGSPVDVYDAGGKFVSNQHTNNPAWVILDILRRCGWSLADLNLQSFAAAAAFCQELIKTADSNGNALQVPRYQCNLVLTRRQSAATVVRGIRVASSLMLRYGALGLLELLPETTIAAQQPTSPDGGNSTDPVNDGWPAYEFSDGSAPLSGIARLSDDSSSVKVTCRTVSETSNRLSVEFQDESSEYQQDSLSIADADDSALIGYEISSQSTALGIANFNQATRVLLRQLDKSTKGNLFIQFQTSFRALKVRPGDIIAVTYLKEGFSRSLFRVTKLSPSTNYSTVTVLAQIHNDDWYSDDPAVLMNAGRQPASNIGIPRPLIGEVIHLNSLGDFESFDLGISEEVQTSSDGSATDILSVAFSRPLLPSVSLANLPLVGLNPVINSTGGTIKGGSNFYYAIAAVDSGNNQGPLSFTVPVSVPAVTDTNQVMITGLSLPQSASQFHVYRGTTPQELYRITNAPAPLAASFIDAGSAPLAFGPPDSNFDHANFYYRHEYAGPFPVDIFSNSTVGSSNMGAPALVYNGMVARIIEGPGRGQERVITGNSATTLDVTPNWSVVPDPTSQFVIAEGAWKFAAVSGTSPARFEVAYQAGTVLQILGRSANVHNQEADADLCPLTRWHLGGGQADLGIAEAPAFKLSAPGGGVLQLSQIDFSDLANTSSVTSGTLQLFVWNELSTPSQYTLAAPSDAITPALQITGNPALNIGDVVQIGAELITVLGAGGAAGAFNVARASLASAAATHAAGDPVLPLSQKTVVVPFAPGFFENRASQNFIHPFSLPDARVAAAEFYVTNAFGDGESSQTCYLASGQTGLRTLSGGQLSFQVSGYLATETGAAPALTVQATHAVRDVRASVAQSALGYDLSINVVENGAVYCGLTIPAGATESTIVDGTNLPPLIEGAGLSLNLTLTPTTGISGQPVPPRDLTVTVRF